MPMAFLPPGSPNHRASSPASLPFQTQVPDTDDSHISIVPDIHDLIDLDDDESTFSCDPPLFSNSTICRTVLPDPSESLLDTPIPSERASQLLHTDNQSAMSYYRLTRLSHSFAHVVHSSPLPVTSALPTPIGVVLNHRPVRNIQDFPVIAPTQIT